MSREVWREACAEFLGTFTLIAFGIAVVAQVVLSGKSNGEYVSINLAWGLAVTMGIFIAGGVSAAHLNPAVTLALTVHRGFARNKVIPYIVAQLAGAFVASAVVYYTYAEALKTFDEGVRQVGGAHDTAAIWATYPQEFLTNFPGGFVDQVVGTALLVMVIFGISDPRNTALPSYLGPFAVGLLVALIGMTYGYNAGYAINPARDLGPRLFTAVAGWSTEVFRAHDHWWWVPVVGPCVGGVLGGGIYDLFITRNYPVRMDQLH